VPRCLAKCVEMPLLKSIDDANFFRASRQELIGKREARMNDAPPVTNTVFAAKNSHPLSSRLS